MANTTIAQDKADGQASPMRAPICASCGLMPRLVDGVCVVSDDWVRVAHSCPDCAMQTAIKDGADDIREIVKRFCRVCWRENIDLSAPSAKQRICAECVAAGYGYDESHFEPEPDDELPDGWPYIEDAPTPVESAEEAAERQRLVNRVAMYANPMAGQSCTATADARRFIAYRPSELMLVEWRGRSRTDDRELHNFAPVKATPQGYWEYDEGEFKDWMSAAGEQWLHQALQITRVSEDDKASRKAMNSAIGWVRKGVRSKARYEGMLAQINHAVTEMRKEGTLPKELTIVKAEEIGRNKTAFPARNGAVDLATKRLLSPAQTRELLIPAVNAGPASYDPNAERECDIPDRLIAHLPPDVQDYLWAALGQCLWRRPRDRFIVLVSAADTLGIDKGREGKSTLCLGLQSAVGLAYAPGISRNALRNVRADGGAEGPAPEGADLVFGAYGICSEIGDWRIGLERLKARTGGDLITYRALYGKAFIHAPVGVTFIMACNELPFLGLTDGALQKRLIIVEYTKPPSPDASIKNAFQEAVDDGADTPAARAMLARLIDRAAENTWREDIEPPSTVKGWVAKAINNEASDFDKWVSRTVVQSGHPDDRLGFSLVWQAWAEANNADAKQSDIAGVNRRSATKSFKRKFGLGATIPVRVGQWRGTGWVGIRLATSAEMADETGYCAGACAREVPLSALEDGYCGACPHE